MTTTLETSETATTMLSIEAPQAFLYREALSRCTGLT